MDLFTIATCKIPEAKGEILVKGTNITRSYRACSVLTRLLAKECVSEAGKHHCKAIGGTCHIERDGYYIVTNACMIFGVLFLIAFITPSARKLQGKHSERNYTPEELSDDTVSQHCLPQHGG